MYRVLPTWVFNNLDYGCQQSSVLMAFSFVFSLIHGRISDDVWFSFPQYWLSWKPWIIVETFSSCPQLHQPHSKSQTFISKMVLLTHFAAHITWRNSNNLLWKWSCKNYLFSVTQRWYIFRDNNILCVQVLRAAFKRKQFVCKANNNL